LVWIFHLNYTIVIHDVSFLLGLKTIPVSLPGEDTPHISHTQDLIIAHSHQLEKGFSRTLKSQGEK
jgi:hypothetical protein